MREESISFKTAKLANQKGVGLEKFSSSGIIIDKSKIGSTNNSDYAWICKQSLLQKYLREVHNIFVIVELDCTSYPKYYYNVYQYKDLEWSNKVKYGDKANPSLHRTYEETLEEGLYNALKLI